MKHKGEIVILRLSSLGAIQNCFVKIKSLFWLFTYSICSGNYSH